MTCSSYSKRLSIFKRHDLGKTSVIYPVESKNKHPFFNSTGASSVVYPPRRRSVPSSIAPGSARWMWSLPRKSSACCRSARCNARQTVAVAAPSGAEVRQWRKWSWHDWRGSVIKVARWRFSSSQALLVQIALMHNRCCFCLPKIQPKLWGPQMDSILYCSTLLGWGYLWLFIRENILPGPPFVGSNAATNPMLFTDWWVDWIGVWGYK